MLKTCWFMMLLIPILWMTACTIDLTEQIERIASPDRVVDAVIVKSNGGATTSYAYSVHIVPVNGTLQKGHEIFKSDKVDALNVFWQEPCLLIIEYEKARIFSFQNFWSSREIQNFKYTVEIQLRPLSERSI